MAEYVMPPEMEDFMEAAGDVAMDNFDPAAFEADPSAAFADTMGAVMDFMGDAGMPPDMMDGFNDIATGVFDQYMGDNPDAAPMEAFDAVGAGIDHQMADMAPDMPAADMAGEMPPPPEDFGAFIDECPPCGSFEGGEGYDAAAHPHEGGMADMMDTYGPPPGDMAGPGPDAGGPPPGDMAGEPPMGDDFGGDQAMPMGAQPGPDGRSTQWVNQDQWTADQADQVIWVLLWVNQDQWTADQVEPIHYSVKQVQQVAHLQATCLRVILQWVNQDQWTADQADQVIWLLQWMIWVQRNLTWMMQQLMALKILDQELLNLWQVIWMEMA